MRACIPLTQRINILNGLAYEVHDLLPISLNVHTSLALRLFPFSAYFFTSAVSLSLSLSRLRYISDTLDILQLQTDPCLLLSVVVHNINTK